MEDIKETLKPLGYEYLVSTTSIPGPGNLIVVYATLGDYYVACISRDNKVLWNYSCGGTSNSNEV